MKACLPNANRNTFHLALGGTFVHFEYEVVFVTRSLNVIEEEGEKKNLARKECGNHRVGVRFGPNSSESEYGS